MYIRGVEPMNSLLANPLFRALFNSPVPRILVNADAPEFTIVVSNHVHIIASHLSDQDVLGKPLWGVFESDEGEEEVNLLMAALTEALQYNHPVLTSPFRGDVPAFDKYNEEEKVWQFEILPVEEYDGTPRHLLITFYPVTEQINKHEAESTLKSLITKARYPLMILRGADWLIEIANQQIANLWGLPLSDITGRKLLDILPELKGQPFPALLTNVYRTGVSCSKEEEVFYLDTPEGRIEKYVNFSYEPLLDNEQHVSGIIVSAYDVTDIVNSRNLLEDSNKHQQELNEKLEATNEELTSAIEDLLSSHEEVAKSNEELIRSRAILQRINRSLADSEIRFRSLIQQAPVAICVLTGRDLVIEAVNDRMLSFWGKADDIMDKPLASALPELKGQPFLKLLDNTFITGSPYFGNEAKALLEHEGELVEGYFNFTYQPIKNDTGATIAIMMVATEVTEQVNSRKELERVYEQVRLSKQAAQLGTFDMDIAKGTMEWDERSRELFGISHNNPVSYEGDFLPGLHQDDRERVCQIITGLFNKEINHGDYDIEYRTIGTDDGRLRWVRAKGKVFFNENNEPTRFIGSVLDITDQKRDEQRKNDFIGMVSHELKTPLTSLKAYIQILHGKAKKQGERFTIEALAKAETQVRKMSNMINGFLSLSRLETGKLHLNLEEINLNDLIQEEINNIRLTETDHPITFDYSGQLEIKADIDKVGHVISNLLTNAVKYSDKGKPIEVRSKLKENFAVISVKDEGYGINEKDIMRLFERYYRVEGNYKKYISGFGIGLYLSAEIIELHSGKIWVESEIGKGSTFFFSLPVI